MLDEHTHERRSFRAIGNVFKPIRGWLANSSMSINSDHQSEHVAVKHNGHSGEHKSSLTSSSSTAGSPAKSSDTVHAQRLTICRPQSHGNHTVPQHDGHHATTINRLAPMTTNYATAAAQSHYGQSHYGHASPQTHYEQARYGTVQSHYAPPHMHQQQYQQALINQHHLEQQQQQQQAQQQQQLANHYGHSTVNTRQQQQQLHHQQQMLMNQYNWHPPRRSPSAELTLNQSRAPIVAGDSLTIPPPKPQRMVMISNGTNGTSFPPPPPPPPPLLPSSHSAQASLAPPLPPLPPLQHHQSLQSAHSTHPPPSAQSNCDERQRLLEMEHKIEQLTGLVLKALTTGSTESLKLNGNINVHSNGTTSARQTPHANGHGITSMSSSSSMSTSTSSSAAAARRKTVATLDYTSAANVVLSHQFSLKYKQQIALHQVSRLRQDIGELKAVVSGQMDGAMHRISDLVKSHSS